MGEMMTPKRIVAGTILTLFCDACKARFPHFLFFGDDDIDTAGLCSASSCDKNEVVIFEATPTEWNDFEKSGISEIETRLALELRRGDLRVLRLLKIERDKNIQTGLSFRDFKKKYVAPTVVYSCPCCPDGKSHALEELTLDEFQKSGGRITLTGRLVL